MNQIILSGLATKQMEVIQWPELQTEKKRQAKTSYFHEQIESKNERI